MPPLFLCPWVARCGNRERQLLPPNRGKNKKIKKNQKNNKKVVDKYFVWYYNVREDKGTNES